MFIVSFNPLIVIGYAETYSIFLFVNVLQHTGQEALKYSVEQSSIVRRRLSKQCVIKHPGAILTNQIGLRADRD